MRPSESLLDFGRPVAYYPGLVKYLGSVNAVLFFCQILFWKNKERDPELGIYKTASEIEDETGLTYDEQRTARMHLRKVGVIFETQKRLEHKTYYRLDLNALDELIVANCKSHLPELQIPSSENANSQFVYPENTTENTTEIKTLSSKKPDDETFLFQEQCVPKRNSEENSVRNVFSYYLEKTGRSPNQYALTPARMQKGISRLRESLKLARDETLHGASEVMKLAIDNMCKSDFHMGKSANSDGKKYCDWIDHLFKSRERMDKWLQG